MANETPVIASSALAIPEETVIFNVEDMSWGENKALTIMLVQLGAFDNTANPDEIIRHFDKLEMAVAQWIVSVPRSWLTSRAPETVDWSAPGTPGEPSPLNYLKRKRFADLITQLGKALQEEEKKA